MTGVQTCALPIFLQHRFGRLMADETVLKKAQQTIYHDRVYPSHVLLPVVPESNSATARSSVKKAAASQNKGLSFQAR